MKEKYIEDYKKLFLYKSFLYRNTHFNTNSDDKNLKEIVNALNIKKYGKRIEYIYDATCKMLDDYYGEKDLCKFVNGQCRKQYGEDCKFNNGCCRICMYQSPKGCKTSNITCKMFYCDDVYNEIKVLKLKDLPITKLFTLRQRMIILYEYFASREAILLDLKVGSLIFFAIRVFYNLFKTIIVLPKVRKKLEEEQQ